MANSNSFADVILRQNNGQALIITTAGTTHKNFTLADGTQALLTIPNPMTSINAGEFYPNLTADGRPFIIRVCGKVVGGEKYQVDLVPGANILTPVLASTGLATNGLTADNFLLEAECMWDSTSQNLRCLYYGFVGNQAVNQAGVISSIQVTTLAGLTFSAALTIPTANASASVSITEFSGEFV